MRNEYRENLGWEDGDVPEHISTFVPEQPEELLTTDPFALENVHRVMNERAAQIRPIWSKYL